MRINASTPSQKRLSATAAATGTHSVSRGVGAMVLRNDTGFMVRIKDMERFRRR
jgi:hypothetical protein